MVSSSKHIIITPCAVYPARTMERPLDLLCIAVYLPGAGRSVEGSAAARPGSVESSVVVRGARDVMDAHG